MDEIEIIIKVKVVDKCDSCEFCDSSSPGIPCKLLEVMGDENCYTLIDYKYVNLDGRLPNCPMNGDNKMEIKKVEYGENEHCFRIYGLSPSWVAIAEYFNMPYKKFEKLMVKYGAIKPEPGRGYIWKTAQERDNFLNSKEFLPYKIMAKLTK